jgi:hypothetical protein
MNALFRLDSYFKGVENKHLKIITTGIPDGDGTKKISFPYTRLLQVGRNTVMHGKTDGPGDSDAWAHQEWKVAYGITVLLSTKK